MKTFLNVLTAQTSIQEMKDSMDGGLERLEFLEVSLLTIMSTYSQI